MSLYADTLLDAALDALDDLTDDEKADTLEDLADRFATFARHLRPAAMPAQDADSEPERTVSKTTITFEVLHSTGETFDSLADALEAASEGDALGWETHYSTAPVPDDQVIAECIAMANDGSAASFWFDENIADRLIAEYDQRENQTP